MFDKSKLSQEEILVIRSIEKLFKIIPEKYSKVNLFYINIFKIAMYNVAVLQIYKRNFKIKRILKNILISERLIEKLSYYIQKCRDRNFNKQLAKKDNHEFQLHLEKINSSVPKATPQSHVFVASSASYLSAITSFMHYTKDKNFNLILPYSLSNYKSLQKINRANIIYFEDLITPDIFNKYEIAREEFRALFSAHEDYFEDIFKIDNYSLYPFFKQGIKNIFNHTIPNSLLYYLAAESFVRNNAPKSIITVRQRRTFENSFANAADNNNLKKFMLIHGNIFTEKGWMLTFGHFSNFNGIFVWGQSQKKILENNYTTTNSEIYPVGSPIFIPPKKKVQQKKKNLTILFAVGEVNTYRNLIINLLHSLEELSLNYKLILKLHPSVNSKTYYHFSNDSRIKILDSICSIEDYFLSSDLFLSGPSTTALQAMVTFILLAEKISLDAVRRNFDFNEYEEEHIIISEKQSLHLKIRDIFSSDEKLKEHLLIQESIINRNVENNSTPLISISKINQILNIKND